MSGGCGVDRGGGREAKSHDRRTKRSVTQRANPFEKKDEGVATMILSPEPLPPPPRRRLESILDAGANLLSRQLARDQTRMLHRAFDGGVDAVVCMSTDWERMQEMQSLVKQFPGNLYAAYGIHPDNIKRSNDREFSSRLAELRTLALTPECVALYAGLDLGRDVGSHYPQEKLFDAQIRLAAELRLPVIIHEVQCAERVAELTGGFVSEWKAGGSGAVAVAASSSATGPSSSAAPAAAAAASPDALRLAEKWTPRHAVFDFDGDERALAACASIDAYVMLSGAVCDEAEKGTLLRDVIVPQIPLHRLLLASNSPLHTPANIPDHFVRTSRNEPSNLPFVLPVIVAAWNAGLPADAPTFSAASLAAAAAPSVRPRLTLADLAHAVYLNTARFYGLPTSAAAPPGGSGPAAGGQADAAGAGDAATEATAAADGPSTSAGEEGEIIEAASAADAAARGEKLATAASAAPAGAAEAAAAASSHDAASGAAAAPLPSSGTVVYRCRVCRTELFAAADVMPHDGGGLQASARSLGAASAAAIAAAAAAESGSSGGSSKSGGASGPAAAGKPSKRGGKGAEAQEAAPSSGGVLSGEVGVSRWHTAKGKAVRHQQCAALLVEVMPWMGISERALSGGVATEGEGSLLCPGCSGKVGQFNLAGMKCSCGLFVVPAFKIPRQRVDESVAGADAEEVLAAALAADARLAGAYEEGEGDGGREEEEDGAVASRRPKTKALAVPARNLKGNFSQFRNASTAVVKQKRSGGGGPGAGGAAGEGGAGSTGT